MHFASACAAAFAALSLVSTSLASAIPIADVPSRVERSLITIAPSTSNLEVRKTPKRPKYTRKPLSRGKCPIKHPKGCTNTELLKNGDFEKNVNGWVVDGGGLAQLFWVKDSKLRPAHSGKGQAYIFMNRGGALIDFHTTLPAVEYGNSVTLSLWMRYEEPADVSSCRVDMMVRGYDGGLSIALQPKWTKYAWEVPGFGRDEQLRFVISCDNLATPLTILMDDVSAKACLPRYPDPECQVLKSSDNLLVNPGFECPDGITAWQMRSNSGGTDTLVQFVSLRNNPTHSGKGMAGFIYDTTQDPGFTGLSIYQWDIVGDLTRQFMKASFWLSADSKYSDTTGCRLSVATRTGYYLYDVDLSSLTTKWKKFEIKEIVPDSFDDFTIDISWCSAPVFPFIYIDDIYFGIDRSSPPATKPTTTPTEPTATAGPCTSTPTLIDPSIELDDNMNNWMLTNGDVNVYPDYESTYGPPHDGQGVAVVELPPQSSAGISQYTSGFCPNTAYTASVWFYVPSGYDPSACSMRLGITGASELFQVSTTNVWQKLEFAFFVEAFDTTNPFLDISVGIFCDNKTPTVVLFDDLRYGPAPPCTVTPSIADGGVESGTVPNWDPYVFQGDETITSTNARAHTGSRSLALTFPSTSNGASFINTFTACVGTQYTFRLWYYVPRAHRGITCTVSSAVFFTGEGFRESFEVYDTWNEFKLDFTAGGAGMTVAWSIVCLNQLQKVVVYVDDVSVAPR